MDEVARLGRAWREVRDGESGHAYGEAGTATLGRPAIGFDGLLKVAIGLLAEFDRPPSE